MNDLNSARQWVSEQSSLEMFRLRMRGRLARKNGSWKNWSHWSRLMWVASEE